MRENRPAYLYNNWAYNITMDLRKKIIIPMHVFRFNYLVCYAII